MTAPLRTVAFISQGMGAIVPPKAAGSIAIWIYETVQHLSRNQAVIVIEFGEKRFRTARLQHEGVTYCYVPRAINRIINAIHRRLSWLLRRLWPAERRIMQPTFASMFYNLGFIMQAAWHARQSRCKVIHIHNFSQFVPVVRALNPNARIILHMHCEWLSQLDQRMITRRLASADVVVGCSTYIVQKILKRFPHLEHKCQVVFNGTDVGHFVPTGDVAAESPSNILRILFVGRISPEKGVHVLLEAFKAVAERFPSACLELVGGVGNLPADFLVSMSEDPLVKELNPFYSADYLAYLRSRIPEHLTGRVTFHGIVAHRELITHYREATVFVNSSLSDAFPVPIVEAMAAGLPVVASAVGGIPEAVVDEMTGLLVAPNRPETLAAALGRILGDSSLRRRMSAAARDRALKLFSWRAIADQVARAHDTAALETVGENAEEIVFSKMTTGR